MDVEILAPGALQVERMADGRRRLLRDLNIQIGDAVLHIPKGFETDYSSWPRFLPGPRFSKIDYAGVAHDFLFKLGTMGYDGRRVGYVEANRIWFKIARAGDDPKARASWFWAWAGRIGLFLGSWPVWLSYRWADAS